MSKALLISLCVVLSVLGCITGLASISSETQTQGSEIIIEDAEYVSTNTTAYSADLINGAKNVTPRIIVEYGDSLLKLSFNKSHNLDQVASTVTPRIIAEYAQSLVKYDLRSIMVPNITPRIIVEYADYVFSTDMEHPFGVTVSGVEKSFMEYSFVESLLVQKAVLNNVTARGDVKGAFNFTNFEIVSITTGSFAGKGFSKGEWKATLEGLSYRGDWRGALFLKPSERKIYLKGVVSGEIFGTIEGYLTETISGSGTYDKYQATWKIGRLGDKTISATINLDGSLSYLSASEFPATGLYFLQTSMEGTVSGFYNGYLSAVINHLHIVNGAPYNGEGFSIIYYICNFGTGEGWTYDQLTSPATLTLKGFFTHPLYGVISAILDESNMPRTLHVRIERVDLGRPPTADLKVKIQGPQRVSPGETITYVVELRNDGLKSAENVNLAVYLPYLMKYSMSSENGLYIAKSNEVVWNLESLPPKSSKLFTITGTIEWGLPAGTLIQPVVGLLEREVEIHIDPTVTITDTVLNATDDYVKMMINISNQSIAEILDMELFITSVTARIDPMFEYVEENGEVRIYFEYTIEGGSWEKIWGLIRGTKYAYDLYKTYKDFDELQKDLLKTERFLEWLWMNNYISQEQYEYFSRWYESKTIFEFAAPRILKKVPVFGNYYSELTKTIMEGINPIFKRKLLEAMYLHSLEGGSFTENSLEEVFEKYLREASYDVSSVQSRVSVARDPNIKYGSERYVSRGQTLNYTIEYENEGEGIAFGVYLTDTLDEDLDDSTLQIGPVISTKDGSVIADPGTYDSSTRTITWFVGEVGPGEGGFATFSIRVRNDALVGTEIINFATVYFPSVPEATQTNAIISVVGQPNIAITDVSPSQLVTDIGSIACINVTVVNEGYFSEAVNLTLYVNTTAIKTLSIFLSPRSNKTLVFMWNTTDFAIGNYTISAYVQPIQGETETNDNAFDFHSIQVIPEFPSALILPLFMMLSVISVSIAKKRRKD